MPTSLYGSQPVNNETGYLNGLENHLATIVNTLLGMDDVPGHDRIANRPFPLEMAAELISWYDNQPQWVTANDRRRGLRQSTFYDDSTLGMDKNLEAYGLCDLFCGPARCQHEAECK